MRPSRSCRRRPSREDGRMTAEPPRADLVAGWCALFGRTPRTSRRYIVYEHRVQQPVQGVTRSEQGYARSARASRSPSGDGSSGIRGRRSRRPSGTGRSRPPASARACRSAVAPREEAPEVVGRPRANQQSTRVPASERLAARRQVRRRSRRLGGSLRGASACS